MSGHYFHSQARDTTMAALLAAKEIIAADLADLAEHPQDWEFPSGSADVLLIQLENVDAEIRRRQRLKLPPILNGGPDAAAVKDRVDIVTVIERYTTLRKAGRTYRGRCPVHDGVSDGSLAVYPDSQSFFCFGCGIGGDVFDFLMWAAGCQSFPAAIELACIEAGIPAPKPAQRDRANFPSFPKSLRGRDKKDKSKPPIPRLQVIGGKVVPS